MATSLPADLAGQHSLDLLVFDCDGVLIDSEILVCRLAAEELSHVGYRITTEEVIERFAGRPEGEMIAEIERDWGQSVPPEYFAAMKSRVEVAYTDELQVMPGIADLLGQIRIEFCVASSSHPSKLALGLRSVGLYDRFAPNLISASYVARGKPAPDVFIYAAGWMRKPVKNCAVIEDSIPGVRAAVSAGMRVFGFNGGTHCGPEHRNRLLDAGAEHVFDRFEALKDLLPAAF